VQGQSFVTSGVIGVSGTFEPTIPNFANVAGVLGTSDAQNGVIGTSNKGAGVFGFSNNFADNRRGFSCSPQQHNRNDDGEPNNYSGAR
jgi:hypothetical protein